MNLLTPEEAVLAIQPNHPPEASMGGNNTHCVYCDAVGWRPSYSVCLSKISAYEREGSLPSFPACNAAIKSKECLSLTMRSEERKAGVAIYFVDRDLLQAEMVSRFGEQIPSRPMAKTAKLSATQSTPTAKVKPAQKTPVLIEENGYAAAINAAIAESVAQPSLEKKGMSLLDLARAQMNKTTNIGVSHE